MLPRDLSNKAFSCGKLHIGVAKENFKLIVRQSSLHQIEGYYTILTTAEGKGRTPTNMYSYTWDAETGGLLLNSSPLSFSKEPRPVYYKELDILGFDRYFPLKLLCRSIYF